ncbi:TonB-dependent receptor [Pseudidiomarina salinarum]|uniref:TonB-dependent receptor n=1 Tax=Pseudidiomarina salinarum TaxID=435908 RepID=A0A094J005_9GAMM|nr:TonB-dependent receptor [Pseudidiomarina salinarum]KFZ31369.1 TonB-dependent receptor [Pseudidiomarina salinarum]RUO70871.1 TonB-dependent receptor [Pseudidiomarina salinarum]
MSHINRTKMTFKKAPLALAVSSALLMNAQLYAQEAAAETQATDETVERITVTATRRNQTVNEIPYNISVVSGEELENRQIIDSIDVMRATPGITVVDRGYRNSGVINNIVIRGMNVDSAGNGDFALNAVPTVSTYVNDTPLFANFILKDIDAVEILRGPQGTLYGSGSLAGTVRYRLNRPDFYAGYAKVSASLSQSEGSDGFNQNYDVLVNQPLSSTVAARAFFGRIDNAGIVDYPNVYELNAQGAPVAEGGDIANGDPVFRSVEDADTVNINYGRVSVLWEPSQDFSALLSHHFQDDDIGGRRQVTTGTHWVDGTEQPYGEYENGAVHREPSERNVQTTALELEWDLGFATLSSSSSDYDHDGTSTSDNTGFYAQNNWFAWYYGGSPRPLAIANRFYEESGFSQELRLVSNGSQTFDWIVGAFYLDQETAAGQDSLMPGFVDWAQASGFDDTLESWGGTLTNQDFRYRDNGSVTDKSVYGEVTWNISPEFRTTLGMRYFQNEVSNNTSIELPIYPGASLVTSDFDDDGTLFKLNMSYDLSNDMMWYATISEGYRRGGTSAVPITGGFAENPAYLRYDADSVVNYETGLKGSVNRHNYSVTVFRMDWDDPQLNIATPNWGFYAAVNGEAARSQGLEAEFGGFLTDSVRYSLGYSWVDAELTKDLVVPSGNAASPSSYVYAEAGEQLPSMAEHTFTGSLSHTMDVAGGMYLSSNANLYYQSDSRNALGDNPKFDMDLPSFWIANASTTLNADDWKVTLFVKNIFNEEGVTGVLSEAYMGTDPAENFYGNSSKQYISQPRTIGLQFTYEFGW